MAKKFTDKKGKKKVRSREYYKIGVLDIDISQMEEMIMKISLHRLKDHLSDNDPRLIEIMQGIYDENFDRFKRPFMGAEISNIETEFIASWKKRLSEYLSVDKLKMPDYIEAKRLLDFFAEKEKGIAKKEKGISKKGSKVSMQQDKPLTFDSLFRDSSIPQVIKDTFTTQGYTKNGEWVGLSHPKIKTELLTAYYVLKPLIKAGINNTPAAKSFYNEFGLPYNYLSDRAYRKEPKDGPIKNEFKKLFANLLGNK